MNTTNTQANTLNGPTSMGIRIAGFWLRKTQHGPAMNFVVRGPAGTRRFNIYLNTNPVADDSPDADLWIKGQTGSYSRITGLWFRKTQRDSLYLFLPLQEGNFRIYQNDRKTTDAQPDYVMYQYTDGEGKPVQRQEVAPEMAEARNERFDVDDGSATQEVPF